MAPKEVCMESGEVPAAPNGILVAIPATIRAAWSVASGFLCLLHTRRPPGAARSAAGSPRSRHGDAMGLRGDAMGPNEVPAGAMVRGGRFPRRYVLVNVPGAREQLARRGNLLAPRGLTGTPWGLPGDTMESPMAFQWIPVAPPRRPCGNHLAIGSTEP